MHSGSDTDSYKSGSGDHVDQAWDEDSPSVLEDEVEDLQSYEDEDKDSVL